MISRSLVRDFKHALGGENVFTAEADRMAYSYDAAVVDPVAPALVVRPRTIPALGAAVQLCARHGLKVTVRGAGTNLSGGTIPHPGGVVILTTGLDRIIEINRDDLYARVEPGVITARFAAAVAKQGLFYPPDPGSQAVSTLGGNVAENAGGLRGLKYGVTGNYVLGLEFFDANGELVKAGGCTVKWVSGYSLSSLLVASEGTLGVISSITLRLVPPPAASQALTAVFASMEAAAETVAAIVAARITPATLEFLDNFTIRTVENYSKIGLPVDAAALLLVEVDGHPVQVAEEAAEVAAICRQNGAQVKVAADGDERQRLWQARRDALPALAKLKPTVVLEDATVPRSRVPAMVQSIKEIGAEYDLTIGTFGHAGDGNLHPTICTDRRDREEWRRVEAAVAAIFERALALGGTLSGEHGIGLAKAAFLPRETTSATIAYCRRLKAALDPGHILNPGKIIGA